MSRIEKAVDYIHHTPLVVLATSDEKGIPHVRTLATFANEGLDIYFSTGRQTKKVKQLQENAYVSLLFQLEGQELSSFQNVTLIGSARQLGPGEEWEKAVAVLSNRSARFKERVERNDLEGTALFKVSPQVLKYLDFQKGIGPNAVEEIVLA